MEHYDFMHLKVHHTNKEFPISLSLDSRKYPVQKDILGTVETITFRRKSNEFSEYLTDDENVEVNRPLDDTEPFNTKDSKERESYKFYTETKPFIILRADDEDTYRFVAISEDMLDVLVSDSRNYTNSAYNIICNQSKDWIGISTHARYIQSFDDETAEYTDSIPMDNFQNADLLESYIISCDESEPSNAVIIQYIDDEYYRVLLDSECLLEINSENNSEDVEESDDSGYDPYEYNEYLANLRAEILKDRIPYGNT